MNVYRYKGRYLTGDRARGIIVALSVEEAVRLLQNRGIFVKPGDVKRQRFSLAAFMPLFSWDWYFIFSSLYKLVGKVPPPEAVQILIEDQINPKIALFLFKVREAMEEGLHLSEALEKAGAPKEAVDIVANGERSGRLVEVLERLSEIYKERKEFSRQFLSSLVAPAVIFAILFVMVVFFIPPILSQFGSVLQGIVPGYRLPTLTRLVIKFGKHATEFAVVFVVLSVSLTAGFVSLYRKSLVFKKGVDRFAISFPFVGAGYVAMHLYKAFMNFYVLYRTGFRISEILQSIIDGTGNFYLRRAWQVVYDVHVRQSFPLDRAFAYHPFIPTPVKNLIAIGVKSGELSDRLRDALEYLRDRFYTYSERLKGMITPTVFVTALVIVSLVFFAVVMPIFKLLQSLQNMQ